MPWDKNDYPSSLKNFDEATRNKAIEIANAMIEEGYDENRAIPIATDQAKEWADGASKDEKDEMKNISNSTLKDHEEDEYDTDLDLLDNDVLVKPHEDGWAAQTVGAERADQVFDKKEDAIERAKEIAENKESKVLVQDKDGNKQDKISFE
ncbi:DUF2188 domain-containing protein [Allobacillus sp. GCM10007491]|uniref:DUF2188 domain-containing protein n=1 Tax=Allobacillus saliphilus TaxID=2912308 RepID=A0A941CUU0_9BACI|nr:DUF2188 domain-containing protein [Allobacillus saliphilus]MBR7552645.1 DUF2188 domain-containing protein [Allobacillus saliphilus]